MNRGFAMIPALAFASCGSQPGNASKPASTVKAETAASASNGIALEPGEWEVTMTNTLPDVPGMPAAARERTSRPFTDRVCITPEQLRSANGVFLGGNNADCDYKGLQIGAGRIRGTSTCNYGGSKATATWNGTFTGTSYEVDQRIQSVDDGAPIEITRHRSGRRIGDCPPGG